MDAIIVSTITGDQPLPSTAAVVADALGARQAWPLDLTQAACAGGVHGLILATHLLQNPALDTVLVIGAETLSRITDPRDRTTRVFFGDAAGAALLRRAAPGYGLLAWDVGYALSYSVGITAGGSRRPLTPKRVAAGEQFPGLRGGGHRFDAPGGTLVHAAVVKAVSTYLASQHVANDHGAFAASEYSSELVRWASDRLRTLFGASGGHVVFGPNMTTLTAMFTRAVGSRLRPGDEVVCTELDHEANIWPWRAAAKRAGARIRVARIRPDGSLPLAAVTAELSDRTRWVALTGGSNSLSTVPDVAAIAKTAGERGARVFVDGVQRVAHRTVTVDQWGVDAFVTSAYKWYGPHCAALWFADDLEATLPEQAPSAGTALPGRLILGTVQFESVLGTGVAAEVLLGWDRAAFDARERALACRIRSQLRADHRFTVLGPDEGADLMPIVTFQVAGVPAEKVAADLASRQIAVWSGTFYCGPAMRAISPADPNAVRVGVAAYTTEDDVEALCAGLSAVAGIG